MKIQRILMIPISNKNYRRFTNILFFTSLELFMFIIVIIIACDYLTIAHFICSLDFLDTRDQIVVFDFIADKINKLLDLSAVLPSLHLHHLINEEENDFFSDPQISREVKMKELKMILPGKGSKFLSRFVICLKATTHGTKHQELITAILSAAKLRNTLCKILGMKCLMFFN